MRRRPAAEMPWCKDSTGGRKANAPLFISSPNKSEFFDRRTIVQLSGEFVDGQRIGQLTGEFVGGQTIGRLTGEFDDRQTIGQLTGEYHPDKYDESLGIQRETATAHFQTLNNAYTYLRETA